MRNRSFISSWFFLLVEWIIVKCSRRTRFKSRRCHVSAQTNRKQATLPVPLPVPGTRRALVLLAELFVLFLELALLLYRSADRCKINYYASRKCISYRAEKLSFFKVESHKAPYFTWQSNIHTMQFCDTLYKSSNVNRTPFWITTRLVTSYGYYFDFYQLNDKLLTFF